MHFAGSVFSDGKPQAPARTAFAREVTSVSMRPAAARSSVGRPAYSRAVISATSALFACRRSRPAGVRPTRAALWLRGNRAACRGGGHYPWLDDPRRFTRTVGAFLTQGRGGQAV
ncbi:hypothetical protein C5746_36715 [Streptomyces atratus]|uniref:Uncharacterized protein n=1 Tax=Streptomyces atratus TaxID=1893 RepID=A0A2Z5JM59_STRAR|nr:hypothetical protein C5746_36715 [Streptomyces atratus]